MNLGSSDTETKAKGKRSHSNNSQTKRSRLEQQSRMELRKAEQKKIMKSKRRQPYNRTFMETPDDLDVRSTTFIGRVERKKHRKEAQMQMSFISWIFGLFSGLVTLIVAVSFLGGSDIVDSVDSWTSNATRMPTIQEAQTIETESAIPAVSTSNSDSESDDDWDSDDIYLGEPVSNADSEGN